MDFASIFAGVWSFGFSRRVDGDAAWESERKPEDDYPVGEATAPRARAACGLCYRTACGLQRAGAASDA